MPVINSSSGHPKGTCSGSATANWATLDHPGDRCRPTARKTWCQMGLAGFCFCVISKRGRRRAGAVGERPSEGAGHSLRGERENSTARRRGSQRQKRHLPITRGQVGEKPTLVCIQQNTLRGKKKNKWEGFAKASLSHAKDDDSLGIHHLHPGSSGTPSFRDSPSRYELRSIGRTVESAALKGRHSSATRRSGSLSSCCFVFMGFTPITWMTTSERTNAT